MVALFDLMLIEAPSLTNSGEDIYLFVNICSFITLLPFAFVNTANNIGMLSVANPG